MVYVVYGLGGLIALVALVVIIAALKPSAFHIARSITVAVSPSELFPYINNLRRFHEWNPYRDKDLTARNEFSGPEEGPGATFRWIGDANVGEGIMTIVKTEPDAAVFVDLEFIRPFPGHNDVQFTLVPKSDGTEITWSMAGRYALVPKIVGLFISMDRMIGGDFETGLRRLKLLAETNTVIARV
ncbi:MAG TPA: SRPBCC family protein [Planctomycetaceae bacterium]|nr:SRPBCC family protein [Planctomycetaceae bacterium]